MAKPVISVIVPVYNVERYLSQCLNSIIHQTFSDFEVICVNDGSTDNSRKILEEYKKKDRRIIIIDKENGGLASARNSGMKKASGKFICFIDSDDWVHPEMLKKLYNNISKLNTDISICAVHLFDEKTQNIKDEEYFNLSFFSDWFDNRVFSYKDTLPFFMDVPVMAWNKMYRRSFLEDCNAKFPQGLIFEDGPFFFHIFFKTNKVSLIRDFLYYYRINRDGSIIQKGGKNLIDIIDIVNLMHCELKNSPVYKDIKYEFYKRKIEEISYRYTFLPKQLKKTYRKKVNKILCLSDKNEFDYRYILQYIPVILYKNFCKVQGLKGILNFYIQKFILRLMYKIMQVLYTEENIYYIKLWSLKLKIKKYPGILDIWYENDKIRMLIFNKFKISFKFEYSKVEKKKH